MGVPVLRSRAEAFDYMFAILVEKGEDMMEAAQKAEQFAEIVCKNRALPDAPKNFVQQCVGMLREVGEVRKEYPEMWEIISGVLGGVVGVLAGSKVAKEEDNEPIQPLDFDNME